MKGLIHSIEAFGTVDGPGIRMVLFLTGCPLRCIFCHNPEIARGTKGQLYSPQAILDQYNRNRLFYQKGGLTFSGGDPLAQGEFVYQCVQLLKENKVHVTIDTALYCDQQWLEKLIPSVDLWMVSIKAIDAALHQELTGRDNTIILKNIINLNRAKIKMLIRYVLIPGYTDTEQELCSLAEFIRKLPFRPPLELLPYHTMGIRKWEKMGLEYRLAGVAAASKKDIDKAKEILRENGINDFI